MAQAPYDAAPDIAPETRVPRDYNRPDVNPAEFGGAIAQGGQKLGAGLTQAGDFFNQVAADNAANQFQEGAMKLLHGDPNKTVPGPDGQMQQDLGYLGQRGQDALRERPMVESSLDQLPKQIRSGLQNPGQQLEFDSFTRRYRNMLASQIGSHADQQAQVWAQQVNRSSGDLAVAHISNNATNDTEFLNGREDLRRAYVRSAQLSGGGPTVVQDALVRADRDAAKARFEALLPVNHQAANDVLEKNKDALGQDYAPLAGRLKAYTQDIAANQAANKYTIGAAPAGTPTAAPQQPLTLAQVQHAIFGQETAYGANVKTSDKGAVGPMQVTPPFFQTYAKPGEDINKPEDNIAVGNRGIADLWEKAGGDPARVAVGYFSGPNNIAPPGYPTPWLNDKSDGHTLTSQYVNGVMTKLGRANLIMDKSDAFAQIDKDYANNPEMAIKVKQAVSQRYQEQSLAALAREKALQAEQEKHADDYTTRILKGNFYTAGQNGQSVSIVQEITNDPYLKASTRANLANMAETHMKRDVGHDVQTYGSNFYGYYSRIHLPPGDPNRITDMSSLYGDVGNGLTVAGIDKLSAELQGRKTPDGEAESAMKKGALDYAKRHMTFQDDYGLLKDPKGMDAFNLKFIPAFYQAYQQGISAGKTPAQLLSAESPDFIVDKVMKPYLRTDAQLMHDRLAAGADEAKGSTKQFDLSTQDGIIGAYHANPPQITREQAGQLLIKGGFASAPEPTQPLAPLVH